MSLNLTKSGYVQEKHIVCEKIHLEPKQKPVNKYYACSGKHQLWKKRVLVHSIDIPCQLKFK